VRFRDERCALVSLQQYEARSSEPETTQENDNEAHRFRSDSRVGSWSRRAPRERLRRKDLLRQAGSHVPLIRQRNTVTVARLELAQCAR
jgi:hypothetical protein